MKGLSVKEEDSVRAEIASGVGRVQNMPTCRKNGMMSLASQMRARVSQASLPSEGFCSAPGVQSPVVTPQGLEGSR